MPNANGIIYIDTSTTPHKGVSIADIQTVIRTGAYSDIGGLIVNGNINKWAKYKPVRLAVLNTDDQLEEDTTNHRMVWKPTADWWKGEGLQPTCGFVVPSYANMGELIDTNDVWQYLRPRGLNGGGQGVHEWHRFKDFNQYNHNAVRPFNLQLPPSIRTGGSGTSLCGISLVSFPPAYNLSLDDIGDFADLYFGVIVVRGQQAQIKTLPVTMANLDGSTISLQGCSLVDTAGSATLYAVLTTHAQSSWTSVHEYPCWSLNCDDNFGIVEMAIIEPNSDYYSIVRTGLSNNDQRAWKSRGRPLTAILSSGSVLASDVQQSNMSTSYTLTSVTWSVVKNSDIHTVVKSGSVPVATGDTDPMNLERIVETPGDPTAFSALYNVGDLPYIDRTSDYYRITYTFNYSPDY